MNVIFSFKIWHQYCKFQQNYFLTHETNPTNPLADFRYGT